MRAIIQRVSSASVTVDNKLHSSISNGLLILLGIEAVDEAEDADWLSKKIAQLRIFSDAAGFMNLSLQEIDGEALVVSQFTLHASYAKGNRPSFIRAARPGKAVQLYNYFLSKFADITGKAIASGIFGADMKVALVNDGPVTIIMDTQNKE